MKKYSTAKFNTPDYRRVVCRYNEAWETSFAVFLVRRLLELVTAAGSFRAGGHFDNPISSTVLWSKIIDMFVFSNYL